jgi:hypothetical protein
MINKYHKNFINNVYIYNQQYNLINIWIKSNKLNNNLNKNKNKFQNK